MPQKRNTYKAQESSNSGLSESLNETQLNIKSVMSIAESGNQTTVSKREVIRIVGNNSEDITDTLNLIGWQIL